MAPRATGRPLAEVARNRRIDVKNQLLAAGSSSSRTEGAAGSGSASIPLGPLTPKEGRSAGPPQIRPHRRAPAAYSSM